MLKKVIKYTDFNGVEREEAFYFNLNEAEMMELEMGTTGGYAEFIVNVIQTKDQKALIKLFKDFILKAYGEKTPDGKYLMKSDEISAKFACTNAYSVLFMELATNADAATDFINGLAPTDEKVTQEKAKAFLEEKMR